MTGDKVRLRFRKHQHLRLLSHLDLTRCVERMLRRAEIPFKSTGGFHPTPRMVFALSLPLGVIGKQEVLELEFLSPQAAEEVQARLNQHAPAGLTFDEARLIPLKYTAVPRRVVYTLPIPAERVAATQERIDSISSQPQFWVERMKPRPRRLNILPYIRRLSIVTEPTPTLRLDLWVTTNGTARGDELVNQLGLQDLLDAGVVMERSELEIHDETPSGQPDGPPEGTPEITPLNHPLPEAGADDLPTATWGLSPHGPVVE